MAKRKAKGALNIAPSVTTGVSLPTPVEKAHGPSGGPLPTHPVPLASPLKSTARYVAANSSLFPKGGEAFERWCAAQGVSSRERRTKEEWSALLEEFASRAIHGLRRGPDGGTHRPNKRDLRR